jgi:type I restriction enzyme S subunit
MNSPWPIVKLGEVLQPVSRPEVVDPSKTYRLLGAHWYAGGLYTKDVKLGSGVQAKWLYRVEERDFVYNRLFAWKGSFALATADNAGCYVSNEFPCFVVRSDRVDGRYLWRYFSRGSAWEEALGLSTGGTPTSRNRLKEEKLLAMQIPLPPLAEQRRIVARIEELAAKIEEAHGLRRQAAVEAEALLNSAISRTFATVAETYPSEPLSNHVKIQGGYAFKSDEYLKGGLPIVRIANLENEVVNVKRSPYMHESRLHEFQRFVLNSGDILIAMTGATTGKLGIVPPDCGGWLLNQRIGRFRPKRAGELEPKYIYWLARAVQKQIFENAYGGAQPNISPNDIEAMRFPFPGLAEQSHVVGFLDRLQTWVDALRRMQSETSVELAALWPSILDQAFRGF